MIYHFLLLVWLFCCLLLLGCDIRHNEPLSLSFCLLWNICIMPSACARVDILLVFILFQPIHLNPNLYAASFYHFTRPLVFHRIGTVYIIHLQCFWDFMSTLHTNWLYVEELGGWWCVCAWKWRRLSLGVILLCQLYTISWRCIVKGKVVSIIHTALYFLFCYMGINKSFPWNKWLYI